MNYKLMEIDNISEILKNKPRWVTCVAFFTGMAIITVSAIAVGVFIGYTYCYIEHRSGITSGNVTHSTNLQIVHIPLSKSEEIVNNRTINGGILSSVLVSKILRIGHVLMEDELAYIPKEIYLTTEDSDEFKIFT